METDDCAVICAVVFCEQTRMGRGGKIKEGMKSLLQRDEYSRQRVYCALFSDIGIAV